MLGTFSFGVADERRLIEGDTSGILQYLRAPRSGGTVRALCGAVERDKTVTIDTYLYALHVPETQRLSRRLRLLEGQNDAAQLATGELGWTGSARSPPPELSAPLPS